MPKAVRRATRLKAESGTDRAPKGPNAKPIEGKGAGWHPTTLGAMLSLPE